MKDIVANAVFLKDNKVLLEKRKKKEDNYANLWAFPGGHKEYGEDIKKALYREMSEELGVKIKKCQFLDKFEAIDPTSKKTYKHNAFLCLKWDGKISKTKEEEGLKWVDVKNIKRFKISKPTLRIIEKLKNSI